MSLEVEDRSALLSANTAWVAGIRAQRNVRALALFGSATGARFRPGESDLDSVVEFLPMSHGDPADAYFGLLEDLAAPIDLVERAAVTNPRALALAVRRTRWAGRSTRIVSPLVSSPATAVPFALHESSIFARWKGSEKLWRMPIPTSIFFIAVTNFWGLLP